MPVKDIYDTQMMLASVNAAKDMYEKGIEEMKEFRKEYGDFYSPIQSDMDWYNKEVLSPVRDTINNLYAAGIDPLRSPEGRAAISKAINGINIGAVNQKKRDAENAALYIKSRNEAMKNNTWNPDYERAMLGGQLLEEWDGSLGNWTATSVSPYLDYEQKYGHLFDKMGYEYDAEESKKHPGFLVSTKNKDRMRAILSASRPDLVNDPQYQYDLNRLKDALKITHPDASDEDLTALATTAIENEIVERNYKGGMQMVEDPKYKAELEYKYADKLDAAKSARDWYYKKLERAGTPGYDLAGNPIPGSGGDTDDSYNLSMNLYERGVRNALGLDPEAYGGIASLDPETTEQSAKNWLKYEYRVSHSADPVELLGHANNLPSDFLTKHLRRAPIVKLNNQDVNGPEMTRLMPDDKQRMFSKKELNDLLRTSTVGFADDSGSTWGHRTYWKYTKPNKQLKGVDSSKANYGFYTDTSRKVVSGIVDGSFRTFVPVVIADESGSYTRDYYYEVGIQGVQNGNPQDYYSAGFSFRPDPNASFGLQIRDPNVESAMRVKGSDLTSTSVESVY